VHVFLHPTRIYPECMAFSEWARLFPGNRTHCHHFFFMVMATTSKARLSQQDTRFMHAKIIYGHSA